MFAVSLLTANGARVARNPAKPDPAARMRCRDAPISFRINPIDFLLDENSLDRSNASLKMFYVKLLFRANLV